jgi:hypothetical protein
MLNWYVTSLADTLLMYQNLGLGVLEECNDASDHESVDETDSDVMGSLLARPTAPAAFIQEV